MTRVIRGQGMGLQDLEEFPVDISQHYDSPLPLAEDIEECEFFEYGFEHGTDRIFIKTYTSFRNDFWDTKFITTQIDVFYDVVDENFVYTKENKIKWNKEGF